MLFARLGTSTQLCGRNRHLYSIDMLNMPGETKETSTMLQRGYEKGCRLHSAYDASMVRKGGDMGAIQRPLSLISIIRYNTHLL